MMAFRTLAAIILSALASGWLSAVLPASCSELNCQVVWLILGHVQQEKIKMPPASATARDIERTFGEFFI